MAVDFSKLVNSILKKLDTYLCSIDSDKGEKLAYWIADYVRFLKMEKLFKPEKLIRYKRGAVVKAHFGYRIGAEFGGMHYAIVMDRKNSVNSPVVTVIPLTSVKPTTNVENLHPSQVYLGDEIHTSVKNKLDEKLTTLEQRLLQIQLSYGPDYKEPLKLEDKEEVYDLQRCLKYCKKMNAELEQMKVGSIALINQITTISKIRIENPKYKQDTLSNVRVSPEVLDKLDTKMLELFCAITPPTNSHTTPEICETISTSK